MMALLVSNTALFREIVKHACGAFKDCWDVTSTLAKFGFLKSIQSFLAEMPVFSSATFWSLPQADLLLLTQTVYSCVELWWYLELSCCA